MGGLFSSSKAPKRRKISESDRAVLDLKNARDRLKKYEAKLSTEQRTLTAQAQQLLVAGKRDRALLLIKLRRLRETRVSDVDASLLKLEEMVHTIEWEQQQSTVVASLKAGNAALNAIHAVMTVDSVEELMEETREALDKERAISAVLKDASRSDLDQQAQEEFDQLERDLAPQDQLPTLPEAPQNKVLVPVLPPAAAVTEEDTNTKRENKEQQPVAA